MNFLLLPIMVLKLFVLVFCIPFIALYLTYLRLFCKITHFLRNHQEKNKNSASYQRNTRNLRNPQTGQVKICVICAICVPFIRPHRSKKSVGICDICGTLIQNCQVWQNLSKSSVQTTLSSFQQQYR